MLKMKSKDLINEDFKKPNPLIEYQRFFCGQEKVEKASDELFQKVTDRFGSFGNYYKIQCGQILRFCNCSPVRLIRDFEIMDYDMRRVQVSFKFADGSLKFDRMFPFVLEAERRVSINRSISNDVIKKYYEYYQKIEAEKPLSFPNNKAAEDMFPQAFTERTGEFEYERYSLLWVQSCHRCYYHEVEATLESRKMHEGLIYKTKEAIINGEARICFAVYESIY